MKTVIFDLDGTLANINARRQLLRQPRPNWSEFNARMGQDIPNAPIVELYMALWVTGKYDIIIVSGRSEDFRSVSETWLMNNNIPFSALYMRSSKDNRADHVIKFEILNLLRSLGKEILFVVDDRQQVVDMWRSEGLTCLQCDEGKF